MARARAASVLIVEDEAIVAHDLRQTLAELGYDAFAVAATAEEALDRAREKRPDIVLLDVRIQGAVDGITAAQHLQERFAVPVVYLTAHADDATIDRAKKTRPLGYLVKPVEAASLRSAIEIALARHEMEESERERQGAELRRRREDLAHLARVSTLGELSASMAHELTQPLAAILSNAQAAQRLLAYPSPDLPELSEILADIVRDDQRAGELIRRLRALARKEDFTAEPLDVGVVVAEAVGLLRSEVVLRDCKVALDIAPKLPAVRGDRVQLQQVVLNLLLNAFDALQGEPAGVGEVRVRATLEAPSAVRVSVRDGGHGLPGDAAERIFTPFYTTKAGGLGMGLAISRSIIEAHGGRLWAESNTPERGATFSFTLPRA
jgi:C4-dicarboxylate-specific signal transduction histidine kinase